MSEFDLKIRPGLQPKDNAFAALISDLGGIIILTDAGYVLDKTKPTAATTDILDRMYWSGSPTLQFIAEGLEVGQPVPIERVYASEIIGIIVKTRCFFL
ncbi:hypothetical protein KBD45_02350 [Candidatus Dojkabacteria bacterium]|nr:hypothetical protein [Candidatus Dojkabacteria bacterium]